MGTIKIVIVAAVVVVVLVVGFVALVALSVFNSLNGEPEPLSPEIVTQGQAVEHKIDDAVSNQSAFYLELTDEELSALLLFRAGSVSAIRDISVSINPGVLEIDGSLGNTPSVGFSGSIDVVFENGLIDLNLNDVSLSFLPVPDGVKEELRPLINQGLDINQVLGGSGAPLIQRFDMQPGRVVIVGVQTGGSSVSIETAETFKQAFQSSGSGSASVPPGAEQVPPGTAGISEPGNDLYLALGDSLAANVGVTRPQDGYVSRFHAHLERESGRDLGLLNLGRSGESSISIMQGQLPQAIAEIKKRRDGGDPNIRVSVLTLDLGANDLLAHLGSSECQQAPRGDACQTRIDAGLERFSANFPNIVGTLAGELEPDAEFYIITVYNPFDFGLGIPFEDFSKEILETLNAIIAENASGVGAKLADPHDLMAGYAAAWTNMLDGDIHPNLDGYQVMAYALAQAR